MAFRSKAFFLNGKEMRLMYVCMESMKEEQGRLGDEGVVFGSVQLELRMFVY